MDDNNYMNNDNRSSGTPDNTGVFGQSSETANGSDTYSQPQDTYNQPTDTYNQSVSQQESGNAYAYGQSSDQTGSTDGYVNNPGSAYGYANQGTYNQNPNAQGTYNQNPNAQGTYNQNTYAQGSFNQSAYGQTQYGQQPNGQGGYNQTAYGQTAYNQPQYGANPYNQPPKNSNGFGIASLVLGIASIVLFCTCINYVTALLAIIFGIIHIIKGNNKVFGIVGIATAAISVIVSIIFWVIAGSNVSTDFEKEFMKVFDEGYEYYNDDDSYEDYDYDYDSFDYDDFDYQNFEYDGIY